MFLKLCSILCNVFMGAEQSCLEGADVEPLSSHFRGAEGMGSSSTVMRTADWKMTFGGFFGCIPPEFTVGYRGML